MMVQHTFRDGSRVKGQPEDVARAVAIDQEMHREEREWVANLRLRGVKAAHPDDGWVDRKHHTIHLAYPQFNDGLAVGDLLALGWPDKTRIVRITGTSENRLAVDRGGPWRLHFEAP